MNFDSIYNFYEHLVLEETTKAMLDPDNSLSEDDAQDVACVALNHLPARYVRHSIDIAYFINDEEKQAMRNAATQAVEKAMDFVKQHPGSADRD